MNIQQQIRLSHLSHGGGCGCKLAPSVLQQLLSSQPASTPYKQLLVGLETGDDAAVWQLDNGTCVIATTDFFMRVRRGRRSERIEFIGYGTDKIGMIFVDP